MPPGPACALAALDAHVRPALALASDTPSAALSISQPSEPIEVVESVGVVGGGRPDALVDQCSMGRRLQDDLYQM